MGEFVLFLIVVALFGAGVGLLTGWGKRNQRPKVMRGALWSFWIFLSCFGFPLWSEQFPLEWTDVLRFFTTYGFIGFWLYEVYGEDQGPVIFPRMLVFTVIGMVGCYFLEFGEVSNTYNFTLLNIVVYLFAVPVYTLLAYEFTDQQKKKEE